jgi:nitrous oxide reductase accessory protein NosL
MRHAQIIALAAILLLAGCGGDEESTANEPGQIEQFG